MAMQIQFTEGLPSNGDAHIFLMWDGSLCEGTLSRVDGRRVLVTYNLVAPGAPERIELPAEGGKIVAHTAISPQRRN